jgi:hypothetical protein
MGRGQVPIEGVPITTPLQQLRPVTQQSLSSLTNAFSGTPEELAFVQTLSSAFQAILFEMAGIKTVWDGTELTPGRVLDGIQHSAIGHRKAREVSGFSGLIAKALATNWDAFAEELMAFRDFIQANPLGVNLGGSGVDGTTGLTVDELIEMNSAGDAFESVGVKGSDLVPAMKLLDGAIEETIDIGVTSNGTVITFSVQKDGGGDLNVYFAGTRIAYDTSPADTVALTAGTDAVPVLNYVYLTESGGTITLVKDTTGFPATAHAPLATVLCQSAASMQTDGPYKVHAWTDHLNKSTENGHLSHINKKLRALNATWVSGVSPGDLTSNLYVSTTAGVVFQLHEHTMPARTMSGGPGDPVFLVNDPTTAYDRITALSGITQDADGTSITNKYFNVVLWGVVSEDETDCKLYINLPSGTYVVEADAQNDVNETANTTIPSEFMGTGFLIAQYTLKDTTGTLTQSQKTDLRGKLPASGGGGGVTTDDLYKLDGSRVLTGNMDAGGNNLTNIGVVDTGEIANTGGILKIQPDVQEDVVVFGDTDVDNAANGKSFYVFRKAAEGDIYIRFFVSQFKQANIFTSGPLTVTSTGGEIFLISNTDIDLKLGDNAGANVFSVQDSDNVDVLIVDSNGNLTLIGTVDGVNIAAHAANGDAHHAESHTVASHSDTTATGTELETLTDGSDADALHTHAVTDAHVAATAAHGATGAVVGTTNTQTLTNKTLTTPTIADLTNMTHDHSATNKGGRLAATDRTVTKIFRINDPTAADIFEIGILTKNITLVKVWGETDTGTWTFNIDHRALGSAFSAGTEMLSSDLAATASSANTTSFNSSGQITASTTTPRWLGINASALSSATKAIVGIEYTVD